MRYVKLGFWVSLVVLVFSFFHYTLPQHDIVRIVDTEVRRIDFGENSIFWASPDAGSDAQAANRDVRFINVVQPNGRVMVYRNEDTGWGWPPYFKLDSSNLQTEAKDLASSADEPQWVSITHYGWRNEFLTIYPNAVAVKPVDGPDVRIIPWVNILILSTLGFLVFWAIRIWKRFWDRKVDPIIDDAVETWDAVDQRATGLWGRFSAWLATWRGKPRG